MPRMLRQDAVSYSTHENGAWSIERMGGTYPTVSRFQWGAVVREGRRISTCRPVQIGKQYGAPSTYVAGSPRKPVHMDWTSSKENASLGMEYVLDPLLPIFYWRIMATNTGQSPWLLVRLILMEQGTEGRFQIAPYQKNLSVFINGWQSWSFTGARYASQGMDDVKLGPINAPMHRSGGRQPGLGYGRFRSEMFTVLSAAQPKSQAVIGFLSQREQFGGAIVHFQSDAIASFALEAECDEITVDPGESIHSDWACMIPASADEKAVDWYMEAVARENGARVPKLVPVGWCSWYHYYEHITESDLRKNLGRAKLIKRKLPLELIQLDDGYQANVGDWLERNRKFPSPMKKIAFEIRKRGFLPGLWLAPFVAKPDSKLAQDHPDWLLRARGGKLASAGLLWLKWSHALDVTNTDAMAYVEKVITTAAKVWGFRFLKLDFLYAAAVAGQMRHPKQTRAQALRTALEKIRKAAGEKTFLLGCGCPLGSGIGIFDAMRIGPDVDRRWSPHIFGHTWLARRDPTVPSAFNSARNILTRAPMHRRWWWNDPDCLLIRDTETYLSLMERQTLATAIAITGGLTLFSDNLATLSAESMGMAQSLLPPLTGRAEILDAMDHVPPETVLQRMDGPLGHWSLLALFNWTDRPAKRSFLFREVGMKEDSAVFSFWEKRTVDSSPDGFQLTLPAHGCALHGIRPKTGGAAFIGSTLHISQGLEISRWKVNRTSVSLTVSLPRKYSGKIVLQLPFAPKVAHWKGRKVDWQVAGEHLYAWDLRGEGVQELIVQW
jgi:alpha-galactosidase